MPDSATVIGTDIQQVVDSGLTFGGLGKLTDGKCPGPQSDDGVADRCAIGEKSAIVYKLALPTDIREVRVYSMWKDKYHDTIYVKGIDVSSDSGATWTTISQSSVRYGNDSVCRNRVCLMTEDGSILASQVNAIRFRFDNNENNYVGYMEFEVLGDRNPSGRAVVSMLRSTDVELKGVCTALGVTAKTAEFYFAYGTSAEGLELVKQTGVIQERDGAITLEIDGLTPEANYYYAYYFQNDEGFVSDVVTGMFRTTGTNGVLYWDPGKTKSDGGGAGGWFDEEAWYDPKADMNVTWSSAYAGRDLVFGGTAGRIQLNAAANSTVSVGKMIFTAGGYVIDLESAPGSQSTTSSSLTCRGVVGEDAQVFKSHSSRDGEFTIDVPDGETLFWDGEIAGTGNSRFGAKKTGLGTQNIRKANMVAGWGQPKLTIDAGRLNLTGTDSGGGGSRWIVKANAVLDVGVNTIAAREINVQKGATVLLSEGGALEHCQGKWDNAVLDGWLTGNMKFRVTTSYADGKLAVISNPSNDFTGGTYMTGELKNGSVAHLLVTADTALGPGPVVLDNWKNTASLEFESPSPVIGSLSSAKDGAKRVLLGGKTNDTVLTIGALNTDTEFGGLIADANGHVGSLVKVGTGTLTLSGTSTITGTTTVREGTLRLANAESTLPTLNVAVEGGVLEGPAAEDAVGMIGCDLATTTGPISLTSGRVDLTRIGFAFSGVPTKRTVVLVDYTQGGTVTVPKNVTMSGAPDGYKIVNDAVRRQVVLTNAEGLLIILK